MRFKGYNSLATEEEPARWLPSGEETPPPEPRICPDGVEAKTPTTPLHAPKEGEAGRMRKPEEPTRGAYRGELYLLVPPCDLIFTAALDKVAKEKVEDSKESSLILTIAVENRD